MIKVKKCRHASPSPFDRVVKYLEFNIELHNWVTYKKRNKHIVYYCRKCECGADQVCNAGPMGDGKWHDIIEPFKYTWERISFDSAIIHKT